MRAVLLALVVAVACAEGQPFDRETGSDSGGSGGAIGSGGAPVTSGGLKSSGGVSTGGQVTGGKTSSGGTVATGGKASTGGSVSTGGATSTGGSPFAGGPTCHFTDGIGGGGVGGSDTGSGATSGATAGGADGGGAPAGGVTGTGGDGAGGVGDGGGAQGLLGLSGGDAGGASGSGGVGGASGGGPMQAFCDDFEDGDAGGWVPQGCDWGVLAEGAGFSFEGGPGTCQADAGSTVWTEQVVELRVKVTHFGGTSNSYRAGLVGRANSSSNYYTLGLAGNGALRLLRGTNTLSGSGACGDYSAGATAGVWYTLRLEVTGPAGSVHLRSFIDGKVAHDCAVTTSTAASGSAGVYTYGSNTTALFDDVRVWTP